MQKLSFGKWSNLFETTQLGSRRGRSGILVCLTVWSLHPSLFLLMYIYIYIYASQHTNTHACLCMHVYLPHTGHIYPLCTQIHIPTHCANIHPCIADTHMHGVLSMHTQICTCACMLRSHNVHTPCTHSALVMWLLQAPASQSVKKGSKSCPLPLLAFNYC